MAGSTRYLRYILLSLGCLLVIFFISSSSDIPKSTYRSASELLKDSKDRWRGSHTADRWNDKAEADSGSKQDVVKTPSLDGSDSNFGNVLPDNKLSPGVSGGDGSSGSGLSGSSGGSLGSGKSSPNPAHGQDSSLPLVAGSKGKMNATFVTLARNSDVWEISRSIRQVEDRFNRRFHYDWVFLNDQPFDETFIAVTTSLVSGKTRYGLIPKEHWSFPDWIDQEKAKEAREDMGRRKIIYGDSINYRHMCRYESGFFFRHPLMMEYEWYWRVEPSIELFCDIEYDTFQWMADNNKKYSFVISLYEYIETIPTLWSSARKWMKAHPEHVAKDNSMKWLSDDGGETYNKCHFWSNFEIGNLNWLRSDAYISYFSSLDQDGGFFYERWGDAPVHSIAAAVMLPKDQIHFFNDISYYHVPFTHCPIEEKVRLEKKCHCNPSQNFDWNGYSCTKKFFELHQMPLPEGYKPT